MNLKDKIIALDVDGTIAIDGKLPNQQTYDSISNLIKQGYNIVLITGRGYATIKKIYERCNMNSFCVIYNGAKVYNPKTDEVLLNNAFPFRYLFDLLENEEFLSLVDDVMVEQDDKVYSLNGIHDWATDMIIGEFNDKLEDNIHAVNLLSLNYDNHQKIKEIVIKNRNYDYRYWNKLGEIYCLNYTKKDGAEVLLKYYNKTFDDLIFIGDSDNDIEILKAAGIGIAMKNATESAKKSADVITEYSVYEQGAIKHLLKMINEK